MTTTDLHPLHGPAGDAVDLHGSQTRHALAAGRSLHIVLAGPIAGDDIKQFLAPNATADLPAGYLGAPLMGILVGQLLQMGHRVTAITHDAGLPQAGGVVVRNGPGFSFQVCPARPRAWRFNGWLPGRAMDMFTRERALIRQQMLAAAPDVVHAHWSYEFALAALDQPAPHLITCHDAPAVVLRFNRNPYRAMRYLMARQVFKRGTAFTTVSDYMARVLAPVLRSPPTVIPNPISPQALALGRDRTLPSTRRVVMVCNGWDQRKNPQPGLRAFARWRQSEPHAELHLYGADFGPGQIAQRWAQANGVDGGVQFHGRVPHAQLLPQMALADVLLHTSLEESFGVVLAEAMAMGLPVVAGQDSGAAPWVLGRVADGPVQCGQVVDVTSVGEIAGALAGIFSGSYAEMSVFGRLSAAQRFGAPAITTEYCKLYQQLTTAKAFVAN